MKRYIVVAVLTLLAALMVAGSALSASPYGKYLPPDQAFQLKASASPDAIYLSWQIADGYYLYRKRFKIKTESGAVGQAQFPPGKFHEDPNFGRVEVYRHALQVRLPVTKVPVDGKIALVVTYQGCADAGLCYAPLTKHLSVMIPASRATAGGTLSSAGGSGGGTGLVNEQTHLAELITNANPAWFVLVFFGLGVLLAFTPCVLPMVPILAGVLGKDRAGGARRGFALSLVYVLAMAVVYTGAGVAAGFIGTGLQGFFQTPWIIALFVAVFVALALSMFGLYELRLPAGLTNRLSAASGRRSGGRWLGAAGMGALAALIVSPCVAAPIAGALIVIGQAGEPVRGGLALAALSLGMGTPLIVYGTVAGRLLPKAGGWMIVTERLLGVAMLAYAVWLLGRIIPAPVVLVLWGALGLLTAWLLGVFKRTASSFGGHSFARGLGGLAGVAGLVLIVGGAAGGTSPLSPFTGFRPMPQAEALALDYRPVTSVADLERQLAAAEAHKQAVLVDFYADWCTACIEMNKTTFSNPNVRAALEPLRVLRVDVTAYSPDDRALIKRFGLYGPPAYLFFNRQGQRVEKATVVGYMPSAPFLDRIRLVLKGPSPKASIPGGA